MNDAEIEQALQEQLRAAAGLPPEQQAEAIQAANLLAERRRVRLSAIRAGHGCTVSDNGDRLECH